MSFETPQSNAVLPKAPPAPVLAGGPQGKKPKQKQNTPSFLGTEATPGADNMGNKTLLGQ